MHADGVPSDGTPINVIHTFKVEVVAIFDTLATVGIIFASVCLIFNIVFRKRK